MCVDSQHPPFVDVQTNEGFNAGNGPIYGHCQKNGSWRFVRVDPTCINGNVPRVGKKRGRPPIYVEWIPDSKDPGSSRRIGDHLVTQEFVYF
jgi:hypothetical protein